MAAVRRGAWLTYGECWTAFGFAAEFRELVNSPDFTLASVKTFIRDSERSLDARVNRLQSRINAERRCAEYFVVDVTDLSMLD